MKKRLPLSILSIALASVMMLTSCPGETGGSNSDSTGGGGGESSDTTPSVVINSVDIKDADGYEITELDILDNNVYELTAEVDTDSSQSSARRVDWSVSDDTIAQIDNGYLTVGNVLEADKTLTVTATSRADATKSDSVTFTLHHSPIDLVNSRPLNSIDTYDFIEEGVMAQTDDLSDTSMIFAGVYSTKWYVQADIRITSLNESDNYPKFGLMTGTNEYGVWQDGMNPFSMFFIDSQRLQSSWNSLGWVNSNDAMTDWNWGGAKYNSVSPAVEMRQWFRLGLLRDGTTYSVFFGHSSDEYATYKRVATYTWTGVSADQPSYAWIGGFKAAVEIQNANAFVDEDVNTCFNEPTTLTFAAPTMIMQPSETYQVSFNYDTDYLDMSKITFASSNPDVVTVSETGLITVNSEYSGTTDVTVTATYDKTEGEDLVATMVITATDDQAMFIVGDGEMSDAGYEKTAHNSFTLRKDPNNWITFYVARNVNGIYLFADYNVNAVKHNNDNDWWENDNFEFYLGTDGNTNMTTQIWASVLGVGGSSNADNHYVTELTQNADTGLYHANFELYVSYARIGEGIDNNTLLTFCAGSNPAAGWYNTGAFWAPEAGADSFHADANNFIRIGDNGFEWLAPEDINVVCDGHEFVEGVCTKCGETIETPVNSGDLSSIKFDVVRREVNMAEDFEVVVKMNSVVTEGDHAKCNMLDHTWVGEITSTDGEGAVNTDGCWSFRGDWWSWGTWSPTGGDSSAGREFGNFPDRNAAFKDLDITLLMRWDAESGYFTVKGQYHSNVEGQDGSVYQYINYKSGHIDYRGLAYINVGGNNHANVTINSLVIR